MSEIPENRSGEEMPENRETVGEVETEGERADFDVEEIVTKLDRAAEADTYDMTPTPKKEKEEKKVSLFTFVLTTVSLVLATVMITYTVSAALYKKKLAEVQLHQSETYSDYIEKGYPFELFSQFIDAYTFGDVDEELMMAEALKAYISATGDRYAEYYTAEEYEEYQKNSAGESEGIGVLVLKTKAQVGGETVKVLKISSVIANSPSEKFGLKQGDLIYGVGIGENLKTVDELDYDMALSSLRGTAGTEAVFTVLRPNGDGHDRIDCSMLREKIISESVRGRVHSADATVGVIEIYQFDLTTPTQFKAEMDELVGAGCTNFVFDVRDNPGGDLASIKAVLSYFLNEGDVIIRTVYKDGTEKIDKVGAVTHSGTYAGCSVSAEEIGKYRKDGYKFVVLCNGGTGSAAELFTATFRDYGLGTVVGTQTYGKGSMQRFIELAARGYSGALKLTVAKYYSGANGGYNDGYDGVGITPHVTEPLSDEAKNAAELTDSIDNQLTKALESFK